jgi:hypothetical protein
VKVGRNLSLVALAPAKIIVFERSASHRQGWVKINVIMLLKVPVQTKAGLKNLKFFSVRPALIEAARSAGSYPGNRLRKPTGPSGLESKKCEGFFEKNLILALSGAAKRC